MLISNVRPWGGAPSDIEIQGRTIVASRPHDPAARVSADLDGRGRLALPAFSDVLG